MSISDGTFPAEAQAGGVVSAAADADGAADLLRRAFGLAFDVVRGDSGELLVASPDQPARDWLPWSELCREVARRGRPEFLEEEPPLAVLGLPLPETDGPSRVAVGTFITRPACSDDEITQAARALRLEPVEALHWAKRQTPWAAEALERVSRLVLDEMRQAGRIRELEAETESLSGQLAASFEEISLLYRITQNLKISRSDEDLGRLALEWMEQVVPAEGLAIQLIPVAQDDRSLTHPARTRSMLLPFGRCPLDDHQFSRLVEHLGVGPTTQLKVVNRTTTRDPTWPFPQLRQVIVVSLSEGDNLFGWLAALNHVHDGEFGTVEAGLLSSVAAILGIHSGNIELYRQQSEFLAGVVRALSSAIDAKDPYTCGHSDRVARTAVRLARELGCDQKTLSTIYLSGLLHDIGKIGIDDQVLRKAGKLTDEEYEHIKTHVEIGEKILWDLRKLDDVLPVVLHHHESWDGQGYPYHLAAKHIPLSARIVAVADAFDAMKSDRPYRKGMPDEKIDETFRAGAGKQWDPEVVDAFFRARDDIRRISQSEQDQRPLDLENWT
jgi:putative nucleotidyltransferase with HDIG domain